MLPITFEISGGVYLLDINFKLSERMEIIHIFNISHSEDHFTSGCSKDVHS